MQSFNKKTMSDQLVIVPFKFKFFTICYGSKSLYFGEQKNEHFAHISLCMNAVKVGGMVFLLPHRSCILAPVDLCPKVRLAGNL